MAIASVDAIGYKKIRPEKFEACKSSSSVYAQLISSQSSRSDCLYYGSWMTRKTNTGNCEPARYKNVTVEELVLQSAVNAERE